MKLSCHSNPLAFGTEWAKVEFGKCPQAVQRLALLCPNARLKYNTSNARRYAVNLTPRPLGFGGGRWDELNDEGNVTHTGLTREILQ
ncbi:hypothetical protein Trydic_g2793 [Trypoxylus dichotomus]